MKTIGVIGGSGLYEIEGITNIEYLDLNTPWGKPSDRLVKGVLDDTTLIFLPRHGRGHTLMPSEINFRANVFAMKQLGAEWIISVSAVGSMKEEIKPGHIFIPDQFIDYTKRRVSTFFGSGVVAHVSMADPVCNILANCLSKASYDCGAVVHNGGTYICIEGPQFSTRSESRLYRQWGVDVIGMTNMPEAKLAREAEICYSTLALTTDYDCWHESHEDVTVGDIIEILHKNVDMAKKVLKEVINIIPENRNCSCCDALKYSIITQTDQISQEAKDRLGILIKRYI
ncbi:MAG: S-methyl-5'-thioadenosine phosphorylase [Thermodesulfobacteriota bacterium]